MRTTISETARELLRIDTRMQELDREIEHMAMVIADLQEKRAALGEECRALDKKARTLMHFASISRR